MENPKTFLFNAAWRDVLKDYPDDVRLEVYDAVIEYALTGTLIPTGPIAKMAVQFITKEIDFYQQQYLARIAQRRDAASARWRNKPASEPKEAKGVERRGPKEARTPSAKGVAAKRIAHEAPLKSATHTSVEADGALEMAVPQSNGIPEVLASGAHGCQETQPVSKTEKKNPEEERLTAFVAPTLDDCRAYFIQQGNPECAGGFYDYYAANGWMCGRNHMRDWKAAARQWIRRQREFNSRKAPQQTKQDVQAPGPATSEPYKYGGGFGGQDV